MLLQPLYLDADCRITASGITLVSRSVTSYEREETFLLSDILSFTTHVKEVKRPAHLGKYGEYCALGKVTLKVRGKWLSQSGIFFEDHCYITPANIGKQVEVMRQFRERVNSATDNFIQTLDGAMAKASGYAYVNSVSVAV